LSLGRIARGALWLSIGVVISNFFGFIYWILISKIVSIEAIGKAATIIGLETLIVGLLNLGIPTGAQRFMGFSYGRNDHAKLSEYFYTDVLFMFATSLLTGLFFILLGLASISILSLDSLSLIFLGILIIFGMGGGWSTVGQSFCNTVVKTEYVALSQLTSSLLRLMISLALVFAGCEFVGVMVGYVVASLVFSILQLLLPVRMLRSLGSRFSTSLSSLINCVKAGVASWLPNILSLFGQWLGVLGVYAFVGLAETGLFFIALTVTSIVVSFSQSILTLSFPMISGMVDGRKRMMSRVVRFSASVMMPITFFLIAYPHAIPMLLGGQYIASSELIRILSIGYILSPIILGYIYYVYAVDRYRDVLTVGLAGTIPRLILYPLMINWYGELGAAIAFSTASPIQLLAVLVNASKINYKLHLRDHLKIIALPCVVSTLMVLLNVSWPIGFVTILLTSYILYARLNMITKDDLREVGEAVLSRKVLEKIYPHIRELLSLIYGT